MSKHSLYFSYKDVNLQSIVCRSTRTVALDTMNISLNELLLYTSQLLSGTLKFTNLLHFARSL